MRIWIALMTALLCFPAFADIGGDVALDPDATYLKTLQAQAPGIGANLAFGPVPDAVSCGATVPATRALLVGANQWSGERSADLYGAENDTDLMLKGLVARGVSADHILRLSGATATRAGYEAAANALLASANCGDSVVLHFSGWAFGADMFEPSDNPAGPFAFDAAGNRLSDWGSFGLGVQPASALIAQGPWYVLNQSGPGKADLLSAAALSDFVTRLRNRGADVTAIIDTSSAEDMRLEDRQAQVDPVGLWRSRLNPVGSPVAVPLLLGSNAGGLTVLYGTASGELTLEMLLPKGAPDRAYYGAFSLQWSSPC